MENRDYRGNEDIAERIRNVVTDALESMEFGQLNRTISDTVNFALDEAKRQAKDKIENSEWMQKPKENEQKPLAIRVNWKGKVSGVLLTVFGGIGTGIFGLTTLILLLLMLFFFEESIGWVITGISGVILGVFLTMLCVGICRNSRIDRLKKYVREMNLQGKTYCTLEQLGRSTAKSLPYVRKDLKKILALGMLPDTRMDDQETCLMLNQETYEQYRMTQDSLKKQQLEEEQKKRLEEKKQQQKTETEQQNEEENEVFKAISRGEKYMEVLDNLRESMNGQPITEKLIRLDTVLERMFAVLKKHPEQLDELERFMEYYLPTTVKLVTSYHEFAQVEFPGENIKNAKTEIEQTLDTINSAFEKLLDDIYQDTAFDVLTDASVLQSMMAREGLTESDFSSH